MAKMFYTLEEVCQKLGKTGDEITEMVRSGQIQEFRDRDRLMFKVDQIDLLAGGEDDASEVHLELEDSAAGSSGLALQQSGEGSGVGLADSREETGISVFDTDHTGAAASDAEGTRADEKMAPAEEEEELALDAVGSGSGLLDLTRESEETSLGAELLEEVYSADENAEIPAHASGLFEAAGLEKADDTAAPAGAAGPGAAVGPMLIEVYDGTGSGFGAGRLIGALAAMVCVGIITVVAVGGATPDLAVKLGQSSGSLWIWAGGFLGVTLVLGLVGLFIGKASE